MIKKKIILNCKKCKKEFSSYKSNNKKFCSLKCYWDSMEGRIPKYHFEKGIIPWNKGLTKEMDKRIKLQTQKISGKRDESKLINCKLCNKEVIIKSRNGKYCSECKIEMLKKWARKNYMNHKENRRIYLQKPDVKLKKEEYMGEWRIKNKEKLNKKTNEYHKNRKRFDKNFLIIARLRNCVLKALKIYTKTGKIMSSKKYGIDYLAVIEYLKPFPEDLSNYHVDHIQPLCSFNFVNEDGSTNIEEVKKAFAPENHQWLTAKENLSKGGRIL